MGESGWPWKIMEATRVVPYAKARSMGFYSWELRSKGVVEKVTPSTFSLIHRPPQIPAPNARGFIFTSTPWLTPSAY